MRPKRLFVSLGASILLGGFVFFVLLGTFSRHAPPIPIQYAARIGSWNGDGPFPPGARFLVTNTTPGTLMVKLSTIEVRTGSVWTAHSGLAIPPFALTPHTGIYVNIEPEVWPLGPWRIKGSAADKLAGAARVRAGIGMLARHWAHGLNYSGNPLSTNNTYYDHDYQILSQEVPNH